MCYLLAKGTLRGGKWGKQPPASIFQRFKASHNLNWRAGFLNPLFLFLVSNLSIGIRGDS